jgi:hypothetical protein
VLTANYALKLASLTSMEVPADAAPPPPAEEQVLPAYWELMGESDHAAYLTLRQTVSSSAWKHCRHHSNEVNRDILNTIHTFVIRSDADDWKRALVCGICWLRELIAINTRQLRLLVLKCKSSINAMFQNIGYVTARRHPTTVCNRAVLPRDQGQLRRTQEVDNTRSEDVTRPRPRCSRHHRVRPRHPRDRHECRAAHWPGILEVTLVR